MGLNTEQRIAWLTAQLDSAGLSGSALLAQLKGENSAAEARLKSGRIDSTSGNGKSASFSDGLSPQDMLSLCGWALRRYELSLAEVESPTDATVFAHMVAHAGDPIGRGVRSIRPDFTRMHS